MEVLRVGLRAAARPAARHWHVGRGVERCDPASRADAPRHCVRHRRIRCDAAVAAGHSAHDHEPRRGARSFIRELGLEPPIDIAGNSLGGTLALEAAKTGLARRVVAISPAGLWKTHDSFHVKYVFGGLRFLAVHFPGLMKATLRQPWLRELALAVPISVGSQHMPTGDALRAVDDLAGAAAFEATFAHTRAPFPGAGVSASVTVAFGDRDWILPRRSQHQNGLPADTAWIKKSGWGHVPMWIDPVGVAGLILEGTRARAITPAAEASVRRSRSGNR